MNGWWLTGLAGAGGAIGALLRYAAGRLAARAGKPGWHATLIVNLAGSLAAGVLIGSGLPSVSPSAYVFAGAGILGGLTTYSTLNVQKTALNAAGTRKILTLYLALTYAGGLSLAAAGAALGEYLVH